MEKIMIVDAHPVVIDGLRSIIEERGDYIVSGAAVDIAGAMVNLEMALPDFMIVDVELGCGLRGIEFVRAAHSQYKDVKILVMSMNDDAIYAERSIKAGARGFISKRDLADCLFTAIDTIRQGRIYLSTEVCNTIVNYHFSFSNSKDIKQEIVHLTDRELEVFQLIGRGYKRDEIAEKLKISVNTVEVHRRKIKMKLSISSTSGLTKFAIKHAAERFNIHP